jgi:hypothetical protein
MILHHLVTDLAQIPWNVSANDIHVPNSTQNIGDVVRNIITLLMTLVGMLAVIFLIVSGLRYVLANGDAKMAAEAKNGILYSVVGLVVAIAAIAIVTFVTSHVGN